MSVATMIFMKLYLAQEPAPHLRLIPSKGTRAQKNLPSEARGSTSLGKVP